VASRFWEAHAGRAFVGRLEPGTDLVAEIERFCADQGIRSAWVSAIGAVSHAAFGFYEQDEHRYVEMSSDYHREITGFTGNISLRDGKPFLHAHAGFATRDGSSVGGHVLPGCVVFVGEVTIREMSDVELEREPDEFTGLALWPL
jgi:uncharacterized protein